MMSDDKNPSLLVIILDSNPVWWGKKLMKNQRDVSLTSCIESVMVFANSHLMLHHLNQLALIAAHTNHSKFLYPKPSMTGSAASSPSGEPVPRGGQTGKYEQFAEVNDAISEELKELFFDDRSDAYSDCLVAGALSQALCYIHKQEKENEFGAKLSCRILVIKGAEDNPAQYMNLMNVVFTAQKHNVVIDACILDTDSSLLRQACDITGGIYLKIPQPAGLLQYLLWVFLPDPSLRDKLSLPPKSQVDYRAACFCHRNLIDIGYVCSVCLSVFCAFSPICSTCQTTFKFLGPPRPVKKKSKKSNPS